MWRNPHTGSIYPLDTVGNTDATAEPVRWRFGNAKQPAKTLGEVLSERISASFAVPGNL